MRTGKTKTTHGLERAVAKYEAKLAKAANPTQRAYAAGMLRNARAALDLAREGMPEREPGGADVVDLHPDEYEAR